MSSDGEMPSTASTVDRGRQRAQTARKRRNERSVALKIDVSKARAHRDIAVSVLQAHIQPQSYTDWAASHDVVPAQAASATDIPIPDEDVLLPGESLIDLHRSQQGVSQTEKYRCVPFYFIF